MPGVEINLSQHQPILPLCSDCQSTTTEASQVAQEIVEEHEEEQDSVALPPHGEVVSECYCTII